MKTIRLIIRLLGIFAIIAGFNSCKKEKETNDARKQCSGEEFTCTYDYNYGYTYTYRLCQDGWNAYYEGDKLNAIFYYTDYTTYWDYYKYYWANEAQLNSYLTCFF